MTKSSLLRLSLLSGCAAILGGAGLFTFAAARNIEPEALTRTATPAAATLPAVFDAAICGSPRPSRGMAGLLRFAQVEMSPGTLPAVMPAPEFADSEPPLWDGLGCVEPDVAESKAELHSLVEQLVARAQEAGAVRADVGAEDVSLLVGSAIQATRQSVDPEAWRRYLAVVLDGLRPRA